MSERPACTADWNDTFFGGCAAPSRFRVERPGEGYTPAESCPAHLSDTIAYLADGDDVTVTVSVRWDEPGEVPADANGFGWSYDEALSRQREGSRP